MGRFRFCQWLAVSLLLHAAVVALFVLATGVHAPPHISHHRLHIDLAGMVSDRQVQERKGGTSASPAPKAQPREQAKKGPSPEKDKTQEKAREEKASDTPGVTDEKAGRADTSAPAPAGSGGAPGEGPSQRAQSLAHHDQDTDRTRLYVARLAKRIRANLVYPEEMRKSGVEGISTIAFIITESGTVKANSLRVQKSSGYAALDSNALKSAQISAPFERPHKELTVTIAVAFTIDMMRPRVARDAR
jgi:periplasmic protein TonB